MSDVVFGGLHGVVVVEEVASWLLIESLDDTHVEFLIASGDRVEGIWLAKLIEILAIVEGEISHASITYIVEPGQWISIKRRPSL